MSDERRKFMDVQQARVGVQGDVKFYNATDVAYQMLVTDQIFNVNLAAAAATNTVITLPSMAEATGKFYYIGTNGQNTQSNEVSLTIKETAIELATNGDMDAEGDYLLMFCSGTSWVTVVDGVA